MCMIVRDVRLRAWVEYNTSLCGKAQNITVREANNITYLMTSESQSRCLQRCRKTIKMKKPAEKDFPFSAGAFFTQKPPYQLAALRVGLCILFVVRNNDAAVRFGTRGERGHVGMILQSGMNDMALIGVHRFERDVSAVFYDLACDLVCKML